MIPYTLTRSRRKTVALYLSEGGVEVRAPLSMPKREIDSFVASKQNWLIDKLAQMRERCERRQAFALGYGSALLYRGAEYPVTAGSTPHAGFDGSAFYLPAGLSAEQIKAACVKVYRALAARHLGERVLAFAGQMNANPAAVKINGAKTRWGSCSSRKNLNFSWRLIMAEDAVIDYVVVHELAHLTEMNHSARFWAIVQGVLPDFRQRKAGLRQLQARLAIERWDG